MDDVERADKERREEKIKERYAAIRTINALFYPEPCNYLVDASREARNIGYLLETFAHMDDYDKSVLFDHLLFSILGRVDR